jgi:adenylate cyclase
MDYTIIGAEANLAARLQSIAEPGHIVVSYETYALVRDIAAARTLAPISMKGISREIVPYAIEGLLDASGQKIHILSEHLAGLNLDLDLNRVETADIERVQALLRRAAAELEARKSTAP